MSMAPWEEAPEGQQRAFEAAFQHAGYRLRKVTPASEGFNLATDGMTVGGNTSGMVSVSHPFDVETDLGRFVVGWSGQEVLVCQMGEVLAAFTTVKPVEQDACQGIYVPWDASLVDHLRTVREEILQRRRERRRSPKEALAERWEDRLQWVRSMRKQSQSLMGAVAIIGVVIFAFAILVVFGVLAAASIACGLALLIVGPGLPLYALSEIRGWGLSIPLCMGAVWGLLVVIGRVRSIFHPEKPSSEEESLPLSDPRNVL